MIGMHSRNKKNNFSFCEPRTYLAYLGRYCKCHFNHVYFRYPIILPHLIYRMIFLPKSVFPNLINRMIFLPKSIFPNLKPRMHRRAKWFANRSQMVGEPNARMCGWDCEPVLRHPQTVRIPFAANQNLSVFLGEHEEN